MKSNAKKILLMLVFVVLAGSLIIILSPVQVLTPDDPDYVAIKKTLRLRLKIDAETRSFDASRLKALQNEIGLGWVGSPLPLPGKIKPARFLIHSISIQYCVGYMIGEYPGAGALIKLIFLKINGRWYLIGRQIIQRYGRG